MTTLYFLRHGETEYNRLGIVQGSGIDSDLNEEGLRQAEAFFDFYRSEPFDAVYVSTLRRTHQTMSFWHTLGYTPQAERGLDEFGWGIHEGSTPSESFKHAFRHILDRWAQGYLDERVDGGESPLEAWARAEGFFRSLPVRYPEGRILLCSHGRQLRVILSMLIHGSLQEMERFSHHNTALSIVRMAPDGACTLELHNDVRHLDPVSA